jgi:hypothetical protein
MHRFQDIGAGMLRDDERFVIERVADSFGGRWEEGENPPDAYLLIGERRIAVEISTLVQLVADRSGHLASRNSQDAGAISLANSLNKRLGELFTGSRGVMITFFTPIRNFRKFGARLEAELRKVIARKETPPEPVDLVSGIDSAMIYIHKEWTPGRKRVVGAVFNRRSSADILANATHSLRDRLESKAAWSRATPGKESWLALLNVYDLLADADTYRQALTEVDVGHNFDRIVVVSTRGAVETIFTRG